MLAIDVMTTEVITVAPTMSVQQVARLLAERGISAVPVVDEDRRVIGMVSEGDLLHRSEIGTERRRSWWLDMVASTNQAAGDYIKSHSTNVQDVMTRDVISVTEMTSVADIALLLESNRIKRVPVVRDGKLVGIISRTNLVRALAMTVDAPVSGTEPEDRRIRERLLAELKSQKWAEVSPGNDGKGWRRPFLVLLYFRTGKTSPDRCCREHPRCATRRGPYDPGFSLRGGP